MNLYNKLIAQDYHNDNANANANASVMGDQRNLYTKLIAEVGLTSNDADLFRGQPRARHEGRCRGWLEAVNRVP
jgi:hypothetical protein